ncbi:hypothetical protein Tco_0809579 [Tanacetum coccineum]
MVIYELSYHVLELGKSDYLSRSGISFLRLRDLDTITLRDLIDSDGKLIPKDPQPGVPRDGIPRPPRASMQDLYQEMFEHMVGVGFKMILKVTTAQLQLLEGLMLLEIRSKTYQRRDKVSALKLPILKTRDYDLWSMRMEQYLTHINYALWEVIVNGDAPAVASASDEGPILPKTVEQKLARKNELKAKKHSVVGHS